MSATEKNDMTRRAENASPVNAAQVDSDEYQIDLVDLFFHLVEKAKYIISATLVCAFLAGLITVTFITPKYKATSKIYVTNASSAMVNLSDLQIGNYLASDYIEVFSTWHVHHQVAENLNLPYTEEQLSKMISITNPGDTRILYITVTSADPMEAQRMANEYAVVATQFITETMDSKEPKLFEEARVPEKPSSPSLMKNVILGFFIGLILSCGLFTVLFLLDDRIRTAEDIEKYVDFPVLGMFPLQSSGSGKRSRSGSARKRTER